MAKPKRRVSQLSSPMYRTPYSLPKTHRRYKRYISFIGSAFGLGFLVYGIFYSSIFRVQMITVTGNTTTSTQQIQKLTNESLSSTFAGKNILFINPGVVRKSLSQTNLQFSSIVVTKNILARKITIHVVERKPAVLWQSNTSIYVLADDGRAIELVTSQRPNALPVIRDQINLPVTLGSQVVTANFIDFVRQLVAKLPASHLTIQELTVPGATTSELYVKVGEGYNIKFDTSRQVGDQLDDLNSALATLKKQNRKPNEYIDLRIANKVFYQ